MFCALSSDPIPTHHRLKVGGYPKSTEQIQISNLKNPDLNPKYQKVTDTQGKDGGAADHDEGSQDMRDVPLPGLHQVQEGGVILLIHEQLVHADDASGEGEHGQASLPGLLLVAHVQLREQLLCKALHQHNGVRIGEGGGGVARGRGSRGDGRGTGPGRGQAGEGDV